jgi:AraC-like DNA-binding protein
MTDRDAIAGWRGAGLERSCAPGLSRSADRIVVGAPCAGFERIEARFAGAAYAPHRHDTYALGVTLHGVQNFRYRGEPRTSLRGQVLVLHPDELHDGAAGTEAGLHYRMLYLEPARLRPLLGAAPLPFVPNPVIDDTGLRALLLEALAALDTPLDELFQDAPAGGLARGLARHAGVAPTAPGAVAWQRAARAREYLRAHADRPVRSVELERATGLDRFALARHFRVAYATSPYRYLLMRRLRTARHLLSQGTRPAEAASATGFADQSHLGRHFKRAFGMTPAQWAALARGGVAG